jgi:hypothetical protein
MRVVVGLLLAASVGCALDADTNEVSTTAPVSDLPVSDGNATAGYGWSNSPIPQHTNDVVTLEFEAMPWSNGESVDAIIGLSNQKADAYSDLAAIVRFNANGYVDARNGGAYAADITFPYASPGEYGFRMVVDLYNKTYTVDVRNNDNRVGDTWHRLATNYRFRTEQATLNRIDNMARFITSATGSVSTNSLSVTPDVCISGAPGWVALPFPTQTGRFVMQADLFPNPGSTANWATKIDAVVGMSRYAPKTWADLATIVRFNPDGYVDARNGSTYQSDTPTPYYSGYGYRVYFYVDHQAKKYSVHIDDLNNEQGGSPNAQIATDYAYRTEQSSAVSLGWMGAYVQGAGTIRFCNIAAFQN